MGNKAEGEMWRCVQCGETLTRHHCPEPETNWDDPDEWVRQMKRMNEVLQRIYASGMKRWGESVETIITARREIAVSVERFEKEIYKEIPW